MGHFVEQAACREGAEAAAVGVEEGVAEEEGRGRVRAGDVRVHGGRVARRRAGAEEVEVVRVLGRERRRRGVASSRSGGGGGSRRRGCLRGGRGRFVQATATGTGRAEGGGGGDIAALAAAKEAQHGRCLVKCAAAAEEAGVGEECGGRPAGGGGGVQMVDQRRRRAVKPSRWGTAAAPAD